MTFVKGRSGNPSGRPKVVAHVRDLARVHVKEAISTLVEVMRDPNAPPAARVAASDKLIDRGYGKAPQPMDGDGEGGPIQTSIKVTFVKPELKD
jgi:hypothetical protein